MPGPPAMRTACQPTPHRIPWRSRQTPLPLPASVSSQSNSGKSSCILADPETPPPVSALDANSADNRRRYDGSHPVVFGNLGLDTIEPWSEVEIDHGRSERLTVRRRRPGTADLKDREREYCYVVSHPFLCCISGTHFFGWRRISLWCPIVACTVAEVSRECVQLHTSYPRVRVRHGEARYCTVNRGFSLFGRGAPPSPIVLPTSDRAMPRPYPPPRSARPSRDLDDLSPRRPCRHDRADRRQSQRSTAVAMAPRLLSRDLSPENARPAPPPPSTRRGRPLRPLGACFYRTGLRPTFRNGASADWTARKYAMWEAGERLPSQRPTSIMRHLWRVVRQPPAR